MIPSEEQAIKIAQEALSKGLIRVLDEHGIASEEELRRFLAPTSFSVEYTGKRREGWLVILDWEGESELIRRRLERLFHNSKFDVHLHSENEISIPDIEEYFARSDREREHTEEAPDLSDLKYDD